MSKTFRPFGFACLAASLLMTTSAFCADAGPSVRITSAIGQGVVRLDAKANAPFKYTLHHPNTDLYYIDLSGVKPSGTDTAQELGTDIVRSYRLESDADGRSDVSRLELLVGNGATPKIIREGQDELVIIVSKKDVLNAKGEAPAPHVVPTAYHGVAAASPARQPLTIREISVSRGEKSPEVLILGSGSLTYHPMRLSHPDRLVLDFPGARMAAKKEVASSTKPIRDVRAAQFSPQVARVVIDLSQAAPYDVKHVAGGIAVQFEPVSASSSAPAASAPRHVASTGNAGDRSRASLKLASEQVPAGTDALKQQVSAAASTASADPKPVARQDEPAAAPTAVTPQTPQSPAQKPAQPATVPASPVPQAAPPATPASASPQAPPAAQGQEGNSQQGNNTPTKPAVASPTPAAVPINPAGVLFQDAQGSGETPHYTGAPISVNLKNVDLQDFFRLIHEISGLNVVVDPNVKGTLTLVLDNVPWDQALDIVLKNNDLEKQLDGNVLRIATRATIQKEADQAKALAKAQSEAAPIVTTTRVLSYAKASDLVATVKKFLSPRGDVLADPRTNTLIISDIASVLPTVDNLIRELDKRSQQVEIEAKVVAANRSFAREIGTQFAFSGAAVNGKNVFGGLSTVGTSPITRFVPPLPAPPLIVGTTPPSGTSSTGVQMPLATNLGATVPTSGVSYMFSSTNFALDYMISAAESKGVGKLLSEPKEVTQNNEEATIKQGTKIPIQTVVNNTVSVQYIDAVLELQVTPQITAQGTIFMNIHVENTQIDPAIPRVNGIPALDTQSADTKVLVNDGATVMIGGIIVSQQQTSIDEVPYVGSLPIIGRLFRHTTVSTTSQELLFFITPRILPT